MLSTIPQTAFRLERLFFQAYTAITEDLQRGSLCPEGSFTTMPCVMLQKVKGRLS